MDINNLTSRYNLIIFLCKYLSGVFKTLPEK